MESLTNDAHICNNMPPLGAVGAAGALVDSRHVGRARRYQELKQELDQLDVLLGRHRFFSFGAQLDPLQDEFEELGKVAEEGYTRFTSREAALEKARLILTEAEKAMQEAGIELNRQIETIHEKERVLVAGGGRPAYMESSRRF